MEVMKDGKVVAIIPDTMNIGDTIVMDDGIYEIITKTIDLTVGDELKPIYCKIQLYEEQEQIEDDLSIRKIMSEIYSEPTFNTGGYNTNTIEENPRLIVFMIVLSAILDGDYFKSMAKSYRDAIVVRWRDCNISWNDIFVDDIKATRNLEEASKIIIPILKSTKIHEDLWPSGLHN